ncbi:hypothetical protein D9M68_483620 [compost metagenome]
MTRYLACLPIALLAPSAFAASGEDRDAPATQYEYGMQLDIQKVISVSPKPDTCDVVPATMVYLDSHGETHRLAYQVVGNCIGG